MTEQPLQETEREYADRVDRWRADSEVMMREFEGRAILYGEEAARAWLNSCPREETTT